MEERERKVQTRIQKIIRKYGGYVYKNAQNMYTEVGRPDLTACVPVSIKRLEEIFGKDAKIGIFVGVEVKRPGLQYNTSDAQDVVGNNIIKSSGLWFATDDSDMIEGLMIKLTEEEDGVL